MMKKIAGILSLLLCTVLLPGLQVKAAPSENTRYVTLSSSEHSVEVDKDNAMVQYMNLNYGQVVQEGEKFYLRLKFAAKRYNIKMINQARLLTCYLDWNIKTENILWM